jgi:hypothetical protein
MNSIFKESKKLGRHVFVVSGPDIAFCMNERGFQKDR